MTNTNPSNNFHLLNLIIDSWKGITICAAILAGVFLGGFKAGSYLTKNELEKANYDNVIKYQSEIQDLKSKYQQDELDRTKSSIDEMKKAMEKLEDSKNEKKNL